MTRPRVVVTRPADAKDRLTERLEALGCEVVAAPAIRIGPPRSYEALDALVRAPDRYEYLLFMSRNAVRYYVQRARRLRRGGPAVPEGVAVGVVGPATGAVAERAGVAVTVRSEGRTGMDLAEAVVAVASPCARVALVQAEDGRDEAAERLLAAGWLLREFRPTEPGLPRCPERIVDAIRNGEVDALAFASPSSAVSFAVALGGLASIPLLCRGRRDRTDYRRSVYAGRASAGHCGGGVERGGVGGGGGGSPRRIRSRRGAVD